MDFDTYQQKYVNTLKSLLSTRLLGIFSQEIFENFPKNLPLPIQNEIISSLDDFFDLESEFDIDEEEYLMYLVNYWYLNKYQYDFIQLIYQNKDDDFLDKNHPVSEVYTDDFIGLENSIKKLGVKEFEDLIETDTDDPRAELFSKNLFNRFFASFKFTQWLSYQEIIVSMSLLESFLKDSFYINQLLSKNKRRLSNDDAIAKSKFSKIFKFFLMEELGITQRFGSKKCSIVWLSWDVRNLLVHHEGNISEKFIKKYPKKGYKLNDKITLDSSYFKQHYRVIGDLLRLIFKKNRFDYNKTKK